jgi:exosortase
MTEGSAELASRTTAHPATGAPSAVPRTPTLVGALVAIAAAFAVYAPILYWMGVNWYEVEDYSHGFLIFPLAGYFAWERRAKLRRARIAPSWWGLVPLLLGVLALAIGRLGVEFMTMRIAFVLTLIGLVILLLGRQVFQVLAFPLCFLFLAIPLPQSIVNVIAFPLQLIAADLAVNALYVLEIPALREGNIIHLANMPLFVHEACSGLRSLMALVTLGVVFAYFFRKSFVERAILVLSTIPIAILVNAFRVALTAVLAHYWGAKATEGPVHEMQGLITFSIAFLLLLAEARLLQAIWPRRAVAPARGGVR